MHSDVRAREIHERRKFPRIKGAPPLQKAQHFQTTAFRRHFSRYTPETNCRMLQMRQALPAASCSLFKKIDHRRRGRSRSSLKTLGNFHLFVKVNSTKCRTFCTRTSVNISVELHVECIYQTIRFGMFNIKFWFEINHYWY